MVNFGALAQKIFGSSNDRRIKGYRPRVDAINALEEEMQSLSDDELKAQTEKLKAELKAGKTLDDILVPAFATVREASKRVLGLRPFDVQLIGGMILHENSISEMKTGEGKTLVATLPVYLNALSEKGVHVVTVNDYLARRDAQWMGKLYGFLGLTTGIIVHGIEDDDRRKAYSCDVTYGTNNELGFDYLRDNMKYERGQMVQRGHNFAIVDEVDSILVDEARTPLVISGPVEDKSELYVSVDKFIPQLGEDDFDLDEKQRSANLTEEGTERVEQLLSEAGMLKGDSLYDVENVSIVHHVNNALRAHKLFQRDKDYIVRNGEVVIIDEFTGRMMPGRRFGEGQHQALEAKEGVAIQPENQTLASVTFQNYFRMYDKLGGMTGTAATEAEEFANIYGLEVVEVPTNIEIARIDEDDEVYRTTDEKYGAIIEEIKEAAKRKQPVLVGTTSIEKSEILAARLKEAKVEGFNVLNARYHEQEAQIVAQAGVPGAITIATNMAGRGTDIQLGGNLDMRIAQELDAIEEGAAREQKEAEIKAEVEALKQEALAAGGLFVLATERHESRRIDNQLRGRSGRQGDPGRSKFFLSLEDDLMRIFGSERMDGMLQKLGLEDGEAIIHPWINKALERAQKKVEARNFDIRKNLLKFDDVMNDQRTVIFEQRLELMDAESVSDTVAEMRQDVIDDLVAQHIPENAYPSQWSTDELQKDVIETLNIDAPVAQWAEEEGIAEDDVRERLTEIVNQYADEKAERFGPDIRNYVEKTIVLQNLDQLWREHLVNLDSLRSVVGLRGYAQRDPLQEYKSEAFELFQALLGNLRRVVTTQLMRVELAQQAAEQPAPQPPQNMQTNQDSAPDAQQAGSYKHQTISDQSVKPQDRDPNDPTTWGKVGRNEMCPCGSGKKYKHCHGAF